ncbi:hypothetical protein AB0M95_29710 [Sphaerisporangium sp. NPDC051017]
MHDATASEALVSGDPGDAYVEALDRWLALGGADHGHGQQQPELSA